jgi:vacuolar-type H+-ATPase subunit F/Vma7
MGGVSVIASPALADGFRLAGASVMTCDPGVSSEVLLRAVIAEPDQAVVLVTADIWSSLDDRTRGDLERCVCPVVAVVPAAGAGDPVARRGLTADMVRRSIGYRVELSGGGTG